MALNHKSISPFFVGLSVLIRPVPCLILIHTLCFTYLRGSKRKIHVCLSNCNLDDLTNCWYTNTIVCGVDEVNIYIRKQY